jgi:acetyl-CoA acyltransferase
MRAEYGEDSMPETAEDVAEEFHVSLEDQDQYAVSSQKRTAAAQARGFFAGEIVPVKAAQKNRTPILVETDEHPRPDTTYEGLARLKAAVKPNGTVTAGNASGINDGACALLLASEDAVKAVGLRPRARVVASASAGVAPRIRGVAPIDAAKKVLALTGLRLSQTDVIQLNEAFASQALAVLRGLGIPDDAAHVNPKGGAVAIGHPLLTICLKP